MRAVDYGCIRPPAARNLPQKYLIIFEAVTELIERYSPKVLSVETQYVQRNPQSAIKLGMARGAVLIAAARLQVSIVEYAPSAPKLAVVGDGRASKRQVQAMCQKLLNLDELPKPFDAADALALAICHGHRGKF